MIAVVDGRRETMTGGNKRMHVAGKLVNGRRVWRCPVTKGNIGQRACDFLFNEHGNRCLGLDCAVAEEKKRSADAEPMADPSGPEAA